MNCYQSKINTWETTKLKSTSKYKKGDVSSA